MNYRSAQSLIILLIGLFSFIYPPEAQAVAKFDTTYQTSYRVEPTGNTHVNFIIRQKNNLSVVYATDYGLSINETKVNNIKVNDEGILIKPDVVKTLNQTSISFPFANKIVGKDKVHTFTIDYDTSDITTKFGNTWQINIPRLEMDENVTDQTVILTVPPNFPSPAYIDPKPDAVNGNVYYFSGKKTANKPISAIFGKTQFYKGKLTYHLSNDERNKVRTEIALPPDTAYQTVYFENLNPKPENVTKDTDGNILAHYLLDPKEKVKIDLDFYVKLNFAPKPTTPFPPEKYLASNTVWNYDNGAFTGPGLKNLSSAKSIYDFVVDKLKYDYEKINRPNQQRTPAAESLLNSQSAICTDFTNIFVALSRKAGIPARELEGYAISENPNLKPLSLTQDVLHAWPEYFDKEKNTWIQVDPTWSNTTRGIDYFNKLDFNHIVFVIHGENPDYPVPGGGYKDGDNKTKDVSIEPIEEISFPEPNITLQITKQEKGQLIFQISNSSGVSTNGNVVVEESDYIQKSEQNINVAPFSQESFTVTLKKQPFISEDNVKVIIYVNGQRYEQSVSIGSTPSKIILLTAVGGLLGITAIITWYLYLRRRKQKTALYR
jgi:transglutaminase-like putative cysteine protease